MRIINDLNLKKQAEELGVDVWHTPSFLFFMMGLVTVGAMTAVYFISQNYDSPEILALSECGVVAFIFIIGNSIIQSVEQMAKLNKMKSEFVSVASHQLRTPLSAIRWETELLLSKFSVGLSEKQRSGIESIEVLSERMTRLVNDLLDVARIDQGRLVLKKEKIDLNAITKEVINNLMSLAQAKNIQLIFDEKKEMPSLIGDAERLELAIENLISNSIKYTNGKGRVEAKVAWNGGNISFSIKDNGVGIPDDQKEQVFKKFFRSDNVVKYQTEGTGLGLYIAKNIIEQMGGKIWFKSKENVGTTFNFSLPINS